MIYCCYFIEVYDRWSFCKTTVQDTRQIQKRNLTFYYEHYLNSDKNQMKCETIQKT